MRNQLVQHRSAMLFFFLNVSEENLENNMDIQATDASARSH